MSKEAQSAERESAQEAQGLSFEEALSELEAQVAVLESGEVSLDEAMKAFAKGSELAGLCQRKLNEAEKQINQLLINRENKAVEVPFDEAPFDM